MAALLTPPGFASLNAVTTGTGNPLALNSTKQASWYVTYSGTVSAGEITIEHAPTTDYAGTWQPLDVIDASLLATGAAGSGTYPGVISFLRARITSNITGGGTVTVYLNGLQEV